MSADVAAQCSFCRQPRINSAPVTCVIVFAATLRRPFVFEPTKEWSVCLVEECPSAGAFARDCIRSNEGLRKHVGEAWIMLQLIFDDGDGRRLRHAQSSEANG